MSCERRYRSCETIGGTPVAMPSTESYEALSRGVVNGIISNIGGMYGRKMYEPGDYLTMVPLGTAMVAVLASERVWPSYLRLIGILCFMWRKDDCSRKRLLQPLWNRVILQKCNQIKGSGLSNKRTAQKMGRETGTD